MNKWSSLLVTGLLVACGSHSNKDGGWTTESIGSNVSDKPYISVKNMEMSPWLTTSLKEISGGESTLFVAEAMTLDLDWEYIVYASKASSATPKLKESEVLVISKIKDKVADIRAGYVFDLCTRDKKNACNINFENGKFVFTISGGAPKVLSVK
jgi:hypothetical protein